MRSFRTFLLGRNPNTNNLLREILRPIPHEGELLRIQWEQLSPTIWYRYELKNGGCLC